MLESRLDNNVQSAYLAVFSVQVVFAGYQILTKVAISQSKIDPVAFALVRAVGTTAALFGIAYFTVPRGGLIPMWQHKWRFILLGFCMACNVLGLVFALNFTTSAVVAILQVLRPIFAGVISTALGIERLSMQKLMGMSICICGTFFITSSEIMINQGQTVVDSSSTQQQGAAAAEHDSSLLGLLFVAIHALGQASYVIQQPSLLDLGYSPMVINGYAFLFATIFIALVIPLPCHSGAWYQPTRSYWENIFYSVLLVGAYAYVAMGWAAKRVGSTAVMLFMLFQAVLTVVAGKIFLAEEIHSSQVAGGCLIVLGIALFLLTPINKEERPILKM